MKLKAAVSIGLLMMAGNALAEEGPWSVSGMLSWYDTDGERVQINNRLGLDDDLGLGLALGYRFNETWEGRFIMQKWDFGHTANGYGGDALYHFDDKGLYGILGYKSADIDGSDDQLLNLGFGKRFNLGERFYWFAEGLAYQSLDDSYMDLGINVGVTYFFGSSEPTYKPTPAPTPAPAPQRVDSDRDGIYDDMDQCPNTPMEDAVDSKGCTRYTMADESIRLSINFANNDDKVAKHYYSEIERVVAFLKNYPDSTVIIEGHTSSKGSAEYNQNLSERRAKRVAKILVNDYGIAASRVSHVGYGETRLLDSADTPSAHQQNRRIEARISGSKRVKVKR